METSLRKSFNRSPFFYVGDKFKLLPQLKENFPKTIDRFIEPFCGGGSVFLNTQANEYLLNDIDSNMVALHRLLKPFIIISDIFYLDKSSLIHLILPSGFTITLLAYTKRFP